MGLAVRPFLFFPSLFFSFLNSSILSCICTYYDNYASFGYISILYSMNMVKTPFFSIFSKHTENYGDTTGITQEDTTKVLSNVQQFDKLRFFF